jgi:cell wall-associated NlpC family hydrolase
MSPTRGVARSIALLGFALVGAGSAMAQGIEGRIGRFYDDGNWDLYRVGLRRPLLGPVALNYTGSYLARSEGEGGFAGLGLDLTAFQGDANGPYLVLGVAGGLGSPHDRSLSSFWGSWSGGAGYQLFPASALGVGVEARWREMSLDKRDGLEVSAGLSLRFGGGRSRPKPALPSSPRAADEERASPGVEGLPRTSAVALRDAVIETARDAMGRPYEWGGTGEDGGGFDCSGLIQHAYAEHGITLPRTSAAQAKEGREVSRKVEALVPGDVLTFSNRGGPVTHVGLYLGNGRFIHSATRGVQVSVLSGDDPYGRWWYQRWVGARRIVGDDAKGPTKD